jgi:hypothetical protein
MNRRDCAFLLCNCLSLGKEGAGTEHLRRQLASGNVSWDLLVELSSQHLLCPTLHWALDRKQLLACIPRDLRQYLRGMYDLNAERNDRLTAITVEAARHFNDAGVEPLLLKGAAKLLSGL